MHVQDGTIPAGAALQPWPYSKANGAAAGALTLGPRQFLERKLRHHHCVLARVLAGEREAQLGRLAAARRESAGETSLDYIRGGVSAYRALIDTAVTEASAWAAELWPLLERMVDANPELTASEVKALGFHVRPGTVLRSLSLDPVAWEKEAFRGLGGLSRPSSGEDQDAIEALMGLETARAVEAFDETLAHGLHAFGLAVDEHFLLHANGQSVRGETEPQLPPPPSGTPIASGAPSGLSWEMCLSSFPSRLDAVAEAIRAAVDLAIAGDGAIPDRRKVWDVLAAGEVRGYVVEVDKDNPRSMTIERATVSWENFRKRWASYTQSTVARAPSRSGLISGDCGG